MQTHHKNVGTLGTLGTTSIHAGFSVPSVWEQSGNSGNKSGNTDFKFGLCNPSPAGNRHFSTFNKKVNTMTAVLEAANDSVQLTADDFVKCGSYLYDRDGIFRQCYVIRSDFEWARFYPLIKSGSLCVAPATFIPPKTKDGHGAWTREMLTYQSGYIAPGFFDSRDEQRAFCVPRNFKREDRQRGYTVDWQNPDSIKQFLVRVEGYIHNLDIASIETESGIRHELYDPETGSCEHCAEHSTFWGVYDFDPAGSEITLTHGVIAYTWGVRKGEELFSAQELNIG